MKPFSRIPVDLTLEQTINADAASKASGIVNMTNSFSARQKWSITHSLRTSVISKVMEFCNMKSTDDITKDLKKSTINKSTKNLQALMQLIQQNTIPFRLELSEDHLYNISKGQSVNDEVGNDYNPAFFRKGKKKPFSILKQNENFQEAFIHLLRIKNTELTTTNEVVKIIEDPSFEELSSDLQESDITSEESETDENDSDVSSEDLSDESDED
ncbi:unnamed protein product [Colias eurytheme]|nr:unnamed protein product [Colias eurytheme]